jgi:SHS2 domain-containing protein
MLMVEGAHAGYGWWVSTHRGHCQLEHPADLLLHFWAPTEAELLVEGARALIEVLTEAATLTADGERRIQIDAMDDGDRLVCWLNEVLVLATLDGFLLTDADVTLQDRGLTAVVRGQANAIALLRTELKSVTYHDLLLRRDADRVVGQVVVDV